MLQLQTKSGPKGWETVSISNQREMLEETQARWERLFPDQLHLWRIIEVKPEPLPFLQREASGAVVFMVAVMFLGGMIALALLQ